MILNTDFSLMSDKSIPSYPDMFLKNLMSCMCEGQGESWFYHVPGLERVWIDWKKIPKWGKERNKARVWLWGRMQENAIKDKFPELEINQTLLLCLFLLPQAHLLLFSKIRDSNHVGTLECSSYWGKEVSNRLKSDWLGREKGESWWWLTWKKGPPWDTESHLRSGNSNGGILPWRFQNDPGDGKRGVGRRTPPE